MKPIAYVRLLAFALVPLSTFTASAMYDPSLGRWINRDPLGEPGFHAIRRVAEGKTRPGRLTVGAELIAGPNLYWFVGNRPINVTDPAWASGLRKSSLRTKWSSWTIKPVCPGWTVLSQRLSLHSAATLSIRILHEQMSACQRLGTCSWSVGGNLCQRHTHYSAQRRCRSSRIRTLCDDRA